MESLTRTHRWKLAIGMTAFAVALSLLCTPAHSLTLHDGDTFLVNLDTTLSWGLKWRVQKRDNDLIGIANGGNKTAVNNDDGNLNYDRGLVSHVFKITPELEIRGDYVGAFVRATAFYDLEVADTARTDLTDEAKDEVESVTELLDAYVWGAYDLGEVPVQVRVGEQVVNWGESTFIGGSINTINSIDASKFRVPGAELREALIPEGMVWASVSPTMNTTFEGFYMYDWEETRIDPKGTYFAKNDYAPVGGEKVVLGDGQVPDLGNTPPQDHPAAHPVIPRDDTDEADAQGQWGAAFRLYAPWLNESELGFYYLNTHSRVPVISGRTGTAPAQLPVYLRTAGYHTEYRDDIRLLGASFATEISGWSVRGEVSHRKDVPLQVDDVEIIKAVISTLNGLPNQVGNFQGQFNTKVDGFIERDVTQAQTTLTKALPPMLGADGGVFLGEVGFKHVHDMPSTSEVKLDAPAGSDATENSWGYRARFILNYRNAIGPVGLIPRIAWNHDVNGTSPGPGGAFLEDRKAVGLGLKATYFSWAADISYTNFFGADNRNTINDRDFIGFNVKYSF